MTQYIDVFDVNIKTGVKKRTGRLWLKEGKIVIEAETKRIEGFEEDIKLWKENYKDRGIVDDKTLFEKIPILTSNWSSVIFTRIRRTKE